MEMIALNYLLICLRQASNVVFPSCVFWFDRQKYFVLLLVCSYINNKIVLGYNNMLLFQSFNENFLLPA